MRFDRLAAMRERRTGCQGRAAVRHRRQRLVVDRDQRGRVLGEIAGVRDDDRHRFADKRHLVLGEDELRDVGRQLRGAELQRDALLRQERREIGQREHRMDAGQLARCRGVDTADRGMRVRAAHKGRLQRVRKLQVVDKAAAALQQRQVLDPFDGFSDVSEVGQVALPTGIEPVFQP